MSEVISEISSPENLPTSSTTTFLDFPREIRDRIYAEALVAKSPLVVWRGDGQAHYERSYDPRYVPGRMINVRLDDGQETLDDLPVDILKSSRAIRNEATEVLYDSNIFMFKGRDTWDPLFGFLNWIGQNNRKYLRNLEVDVSTLSPVHLHENGTVSNQSTRPWRACKVFPRQDCHNGHQATLNYEVKPAIEACFRILGSSGGVLNLTLDMDHKDIPDTRAGVDRWIKWPTLLPDNLEDFNRHFTASRVLIKWQGTFHKRMYKHHEKDLRRARGTLEARDGPEYLGEHVIITTKKIIESRKHLLDHYYNRSI